MPRPLGGMASGERDSLKCKAMFACQRAPFNIFARASHFVLKYRLQYVVCADTHLDVLALDPVGGERDEGVFVQGEPCAQNQNRRARDLDKSERAAVRQVPDRSPGCPCHDEDRAKLAKQP